jgi:hypothetical protein
MVTIHFNYTGVINGENINGNAVLNANPQTGEINASANFSAFPDSFSPCLAGVSLVSISCSNAAKTEEGAHNIIDVTNGLYSSIREITLFESAGGFLGNVVINGTFTKVADNLYTANVTVTGNYSGPVNIQFPNGYTLPLNAAQPFMLEGSFPKTYLTENGIEILTENHHTYYFNNGVSAPLANIECELQYNTQLSYWLPDQKILHVTGSSIVRPL